MAEDFLSNSDDAPVPPDRFNSGRSNREPVRVIVVGSRQGVMDIIYRLYAKDFAEVDEWSDLQPEPNTGKLMSVVTKYVNLE